MIVQCPQCLRKYRLQDTKAKLLRVKCKSCGSHFLVSTSEKASHELTQENGAVLVLVADIQRDFRSFLLSLLAAQGFNLIVVDEGETALQLVRERKPRLIFVNPYLPKLMGIDLIQHLRNGKGEKPKIFLLGAIHNSKRYRRRPESLYGADDYIDEGATEKVISHKLSYHLGVSHDVEEGEIVENEALRLARSIFADLLVYDSEKMDKVKKVEDFFSLFSDEAQEGQRYLEEAFAGSRNLLRFVVAEYLKKKTHK
jgi:response regulator RpfG family c-di-GMP phosphodiesterase